MKAHLSLIRGDLLRLGAQIEELDAWVDGYHVDIMDGLFAPALGIPLVALPAIREITQKPLEVHLMMQHAEEWIPKILATRVDHVVLHTQAIDAMTRAGLQEVTSRGAQLSIALSVEQDPAILERQRYQSFNGVLLMATPLGSAGHSPDPRTTSRIERAAETHEVWIDGGVNTFTASRFMESGATGVIAGSIVFGATDPIGRLNWLRSLGDTTNRLAGEGTAV